MILAVTTENNQIFQHFGKCAVFTLFHIQDKTVVSKELLDTSANGHAALANFLKEHGVTVVICGGIGQGAKQMLANAGIQLVAGASGEIQQAVDSFLEGRLADDPALQCNHHDAADASACRCGTHS